MNFNFKSPDAVLRPTRNEDEDIDFNLSDTKPMKKKAKK
jgi:hypothetical protein